MDDQPALPAPLPAGPTEEHPTEKPEQPTPKKPTKKEKRREHWHRFEEMLRKLTDPINRLAVSAGCESFLPMSLEQECHKAARIITSLSAYIPPRTNPNDSYAMYPAHQPTVTIPPCAIAHSLGILTLTTLRLGFGRTAISTGSGVLIARKPDGQWGLPAAVRVHGVGGGPIALGVGITDRVYVINTREALDEFKKRCFVADAEGVVAMGSFGGGGGLTFVVPCKKGDKEKRQSEKKEKKERKEGFHWWWTTDKGKEKEHGGEDVAVTHTTNGQPHPAPITEKHEEIKIDEKDPLNKPAEPEAETAPPKGKKDDRFKEIKGSLGRPVYCYMRCRGLYAGFQAQGAAVLQREDANAAFYGGKFSTEKILSGEIDTVEESRWAAPTKEFVDALERAGRIPPEEVKCEEVKIEEHKSSEEGESAEAS